MFLEQEANTVKTETSVVVSGEGDSISMEPDEVYISSAFSKEKYDPEVSHVFRKSLWWWLCLCVCACMDLLRGIIIYYFVVNIFYVKLHITFTVHFHSILNNQLNAHSFETIL
jgi:hypothetical protein